MSGIQPVYFILAIISSSEVLKIAYWLTSDHNSSTVKFPIYSQSFPIYSYSSTLSNLIKKLLKVFIQLVQVAFTLAISFSVSSSVQQQFKSSLENFSLLNGQPKCEQAFYGGTDISFSAPLVATQEIGAYSINFFLYVHVHINICARFQKMHAYIVYTSITLEGCLLEICRILESVFPKGQGSSKSSTLHHS